MRRARRESVCRLQTGTVAAALLPHRCCIPNTRCRCPCPALPQWREEVAYCQAEGIVLEVRCLLFLNNTVVMLQQLSLCLIVHARRLACKAQGLCEWQQRLCGTACMQASLLCPQPTICCRLPALPAAF